MRIVTFLAVLKLANAGKFSSQGPSLSVTLRNTPDKETDAWLDLGSLEPNAKWSVQTNEPPLPNWLPSLRSLSASIGYSPTTERKLLPNSLQCTGKFALSDSTVLQVQPTRDLSSKSTNLLLQLSRGTASLVAGFKGVKQLDKLQGNFLVNLPTASLSNVRFMPTWNRKNPSCTITTTTGGEGATQASLYIDSDLSPEVSLAYKAGAHTIKPTIRLRDAHVSYLWTMQNEGSNLRAEVDPSTSVKLTWTESTYSGDGNWITNVRIPLDDDEKIEWRVRRQFQF